VLGSEPLQWAHIKIGPDGLEIKSVLQEVEVIAKNLEKAKGDLYTLQGRIDQSEKALRAYEDNKSDTNLAELASAIRGTQQIAGTAVTRAEVASTSTAKALTRLDEVATIVEKREGKQLANALPPSTGWYYLGKISKSGRWLPSSAFNTLNFNPPIDDSKNVLKQINDKTEVSSQGYKYLRSIESVSGRRVDAGIARVLPPATRVRILAVDDSGVDPADNETVLWARVEVLSSKP
jgi:hypothetical protein